MREVYDTLPEGEREVFFEALCSPSMPAEALCWGLEQMDMDISVSPSLVRTWRRRLRREAADLQGL